MAVVSCRQLYGQSFEWRDNNHRTRVRTYEIIVDNILDEADLIEQAAALPSIHSSWNVTDTFLRVSAMRGQQNEENPYIWIVTVEYTNDLYLPKAQYLKTNPFERTAEVRASLDFTTEAIDSAYNDTTGLRDVPVVNTSNEPFIPPATREKGRLVLDIVMHINSANLSQFGDYAYTLNGAAWYGFPLLTCLITDLQLVPSYEGGYPATDRVHHWIMSAKVKYDKEGWAYRPLNVGRLMKVTRGDGSIRYVAIRGPDHRQIQNPMPLDADSKPIWPGSGLSFHYLSFRKYPTLNYETIFPVARLP